MMEQKQEDFTWYTSNDKMTKSSTLQEDMVSKHLTTSMKIATVKRSLFILVKIFWRLLSLQTLLSKQRLFKNRFQKFLDMSRRLRDRRDTSYIELPSATSSSDDSSPPPPKRIYRKVGLDQKKNQRINKPYNEFSFEQCLFITFFLIQITFLRSFFYVASKKTPKSTF